MTRYYPVKFPRNRVVGISDEELYGWIRAQDTISDYLISSLSFHRDLDVAEVWKLYLSKGIDVSFDTISFYDLTIDSLHRLIRVSSNSKDIESLSQRLKGTKVDRQIRKLLDSFICNPKLLCLRMRYQFWYRRDVVEQITLPNTGKPISDVNIKYAKQHLAFDAWVERKSDSKVNNSKFLFIHLSLISLKRSYRLPDLLQKLLDEAEIHTMAPEIYEDVVITPYLLSSLSINGINIHPSLLMAIPSWWNYMQDLQHIKLTEFKLDELPTMIDNYFLANGNSLNKLPSMKKKVMKHYPKLHRLFVLPLRCKKEGAKSTITLVWKYIGDEKIKKWLIAYIL